MFERALTREKWGRLAWCCGASGRVEPYGRRVVTETQVALGKETGYRRRSNAYYRERAF